MRRPNSRSKPTCPFKVGDRVEFYDASHKTWDFAATIVETDANVLTVQLDDDIDGNPIKVECKEDFSDVRITRRKKEAITTLLEYLASKP